MPRASASYQLTAALVASSVGTGVLCLAAAGMGRSYRLHAQRPGPELNERLHRMSDGGRRWLTRSAALALSQASPRADLPSGAAHVIAPVAASPTLIRVDIMGALEQRAGYHDECGGWSDGHDAIADRLCAAFEDGDVLLVVDSPGGAAAGLQQAVARALAAKLKHGRRVTAYADEMIGSAAMWWTMALADEIFTPPAGGLGSIGARGDHTSIAGMLAQQGVEVTYFCWPNEGKVAFAPEHAPTEETMRRGQRGASEAGEAFCAAVCASPVGQRYGLTRDAIVELSADMLTGQAAVDAGLADGVESLETVTAYALTLAESDDAKAIEGEAAATVARAAAKVRASARGPRRAA